MAELSWLALCFCYPKNRNDRNATKLSQSAAVHGLPGGCPPSFGSTETPPTSIASDSDRFSAACPHAAGSAEPPPAASPVPTAGNEEETNLMTRLPTIHGDTLEAEVTLWLEALTGENRGEDKLFDAWLRDGRVLCRAANAIKPGICLKIHADDKPFYMMENLGNFVRACRELGVLEKDVFSISDLYEAKNLKGVMRCIYQLGSVARTSAPDFKGPFLGVKQNAKVVDMKRTSMEKSNMMAGGLLRDNVDKARTRRVSFSHVEPHGWELQN